MAISFKTFQDFVSDMITRWGGETGVTPVLVSGDPLLAIFQAASAQFIFLENALQQVIIMARLSTSTGSDVDSFVADFGLARLPAQPAGGLETFSTASPATSQIVVSDDTIVQTAGGAIQYKVVPDLDNPAYNPDLLGYVINPGQSSVTVTVQALVPGSVQNVQTDQLNQLGTAISGIATVTNPAPITNGLDQETDSQLKTRFVLFFASLSKATEAAILFAVSSVRQALDINLIENVDVNLVSRPGYFLLVIDDGSGDPPTSLLDAIYAAVYLVRAFTIGFEVIAPVVLSPTVDIHVKVDSTSPSEVLTTIRDAIVSYINSISIGQKLYLGKIGQAALGADPAVITFDPESILINGLEADLDVTGKQLVRVIAPNVTVELY